MQENELVTFDGSASRPFLGIQSYRWDFGDGSEATGRSAPDIITAARHVHRHADRPHRLRAREPTPSRWRSSSRLRRGPVVGWSSRSTAPTASRCGSLTSRCTTAAAAGSPPADTQGKAVLGTVPNGPYTAYAYKLGYLPGVGQAGSRRRGRHRHRRAQAGDRRRSDARASPHDARRDRRGRHRHHRSREPQRHRVRPHRVVPRRPDRARATGLSRLRGVHRQRRGRDPLRAGGVDLRSRRLHRRGCGRRDHHHGRRGRRRGRADHHHADPLRGRRAS